jgi:Rhodanese-like domain
VLPYDPAGKFQEYARPEMIVTTEWVAAHLDDPGLVVAESDKDVLLYETGHIPGAVKLDWHTELTDPVTRDYVGGPAFARLMSDKGITRDTTLVLYGGKNNWWAAYVLWVCSLFGHPDLRLMDGGRGKWMAEGRPLSTDTPKRAARVRTPSPDQLATALDLGIGTPPCRRSRTIRCGGCLPYQAPARTRGCRGTRRHASSQHRRCGAWPSAAIASVTRGRGRRARPAPPVRCPAR